MSCHCSGTVIRSRMTVPWETLTIKNMLDSINRHIRENYMKKINTKNIGTLTNGDLEKIGSLLDSRLDRQLSPIRDQIEGIIDVMVTKQDLSREISGVEARMESRMEANLASLESNLKAYIHEGVGTIMDGMDRLTERLVEKERVDKIENWTRLIAHKVKLKLS